MKKYDIFISYRRDNYHSANLIATRLKAEGYRVFFDLESMRSGKFNEQLYQVIEQCKDFVLVLPPDSLDRCHNEDDWVRLEILEAIRTGKNIIPVLLTGFKWPETMPKGLVYFHVWFLPRVPCGNHRHRGRENGLWLCEEVSVRARQNRQPCRGSKTCFRLCWRSTHHRSAPRRSGRHSAGK